MPSFKAKDGSMKFSMNPQVARSMGDASTAPGMDQMTDDPNAQQPSDDSYVELHQGGNPQGDPPPTDMTKYHTVKTGPMPEIKNHDDWDSADAHMKECMGETDNDNGMSDLIGSDTGSDDAGGI